ncbi:MAG TPA: hypothetical protein VD813_10860, partial [Pseudonocardia sp.]|nr:hypothetical protein [Pseudonocardia sp.]
MSGPGERGSVICRSTDGDQDRAGVGGGAADGAPPVAPPVRRGGSQDVPDVPGTSTAGPAGPAPAPAAGRTLADRLLDGSATGVLACDERGVVRSVNTAAVRLLPGVCAGEVLPPGTGLEAGTATELQVAGRTLAARPQSLPGGWTAWHVDDVTDQRARTDSLLAERARSRFLAAASRRLGLSLHPGRTARSVVELAASRLADTAVVVLPPRAGVA